MKAVGQANRHEEDRLSEMGEVAVPAIAPEVPVDETPGWGTWLRADAAPRLLRWGKILSAYLSAQAVTRLAGIAAGLILVNVMPVGEYALYTLAMSVLTFFVFVTDLGATSSLLYFNREAARTGESFSPYVDAVLSLRRGAFMVGAPLVLAIFALVATKRGFDTRAALLAGAAIVIAVWFQMLSTVRVLVLRLADRYGRSYVADGAGEFTRLLGVAAMAVARALAGWLGVVVSAAGSAAGAIAAGPVARRSREGRRPLGLFRRRILHYLLPTVPSAAYFAVQGPLVVWLAATFGGTRNIAEVGALGRLGLIVGVFSSLSSIVFLPRLAVITDDGLYLRRFLQFGAFLVLLGGSLIALAAAFPDVLLLLIGPNYAGLHAGLLIVIGSSALTLLGGYLVGVNMARSWTRWQSAATGLLACTQVIAVLLLPLTDTVGVLTFGLVTSAVGVLTQCLIAGFGLTRPELVVWHTH
jgi:O-antigen/teichoic acid export membrane protein